VGLGDGDVVGDEKRKLKVYDRTCVHVFQINLCFL
jgi:hypothetical protein